MLLQVPPPSEEHYGIYREDGLAMTPCLAQDQLPRFFVNDGHYFRGKKWPEGKIGTHDTEQYYFTLTL